ncbi:copper chaperone PCu(A)C [Deinococcus irradiatisoli]|uniref:Copper chaperone PCu(A)C n=1 Tax=Deinococcus irradiatisoli TaxID=2202254 RepID=A0A2Z3JN37_9DEIO|nr:copper chaperone PCu(A)C [Deinococcus irradiatisoli]AWN23078.1 copper chaperone PCu(A)C [Deinococcus irradiatisoli]
MKFLLSLLALLSVQASVTAASEAPATQMKMPMPAAAPATKRQMHAKLSGAFVAAVPPVAQETAAYFTLNNTGPLTLTLTGVSVSRAVAGSSMLMTFKRDQAGRLGMQMAASFIIKPGQNLTLSPSGAHVMLSALKRPLKIGELIDLKLSFSDGTALSVKAPVQRF